MGNADIPYDPAKIEEKIQAFWKENDCEGECLFEVSARAGDANWHVKRLTDAMTEITELIEGVSTNMNRYVEYFPEDAIKPEDCVHGYFCPVVSGCTIDLWWKSANQAQKDIAASKLERLHELAGTAWDWNSGNIIMSGNDEMVLIDGQRMKNGATALTVLNSLQQETSNSS